MGGRFALRSGLVALALAASPALAWADGLVVFGTSQEGGAGNAYERIVDFASGHERTTALQGQSSSQSGFDGQLWNFVNGATNVIDLPPEAADRRAEMWIRQSAWRINGKPGEARRKISLPNASSVELTFDAKTHRVGSAVLAGDYGPVSIAFSDWRPVGKYLYPFRQERTGDTGERAIDIAQSVRWVANVDPRLLARPSALDVAHLAGAAVTVPFETVGRSKSHIQVAATVNGSPAEFIFDTGGANILTTDAAKRFSIASSGGMNVGGVGEGSEEVGFGLVDRVALGGASLDHQSFMVMPSFFPPENGKPSPLAGLLGYEFLAHFVTTIDYRAQTITFRDHVPAGQRGVRVPFVSDGHGMTVTALIDGKPGLVGIDTGDGGTLTLFPAYAAASGLGTGNGEAATSGAGVGGGVKATPGTLQHFTLAGVDFPNLAVQFSHNKSGAFASRHLAGNLGASVLRCFRITFDYPHHQMWLEPQLDTPRCAASRAG